MTRAPLVRAVLALLLCLTMLVGGGLRAAAQGTPASCGAAAGAGDGGCCAPAQCRCCQSDGGAACACMADPAPRAPEAPVPPGPRLPEAAPAVEPLPVPAPEDPPASRARTPRHGLGAHAASRSLQILLRTFLL